MFSKLFESQDLTFNLIFVKTCPTVSFCFYGQNKSINLQNLLHALPDNPDPTQIPLKNNLRRSKIGGGESSVGMTAVKDLIFF